MAKGGLFERTISMQLSKWWSGGLRDDLIWRTAGSGGRATTRSKKGKTTVNAAGDLGPTDPDAQPLFDVFCWELKRGYAAITVNDFLDRKPDAPFVIKKSWNAWYEQAIASQAAAKAAAWAVLHRRDGREPLVYFDAKAPLVSPDFNDMHGVPSMSVRNGQLRTKAGDLRSVDLVVYRFNELFGIDDHGRPTGLPPKAVREYAASLKGTVTA